MSFATYSIPCAGKINATNGARTLPQMRNTLMGWLRPISLLICQKIDENFETREVFRRVDTMGVIQPFTAQKLSIKPEGQRSWIWNTLHCTPDLQLKTDDEVKIQNVKFRVMGRFDYSEYGYLTYELVSAYT